MKIVLINGLLFCLVFIWASAATQPEPGSDVYKNGSRVDIQRNRKKCRKLGGFCRDTGKDCPTCMPLEIGPGRPYCSRRSQRCCYPKTLGEQIKDFTNELMRIDKRNNPVFDSLSVELPAIPSNNEITEPLIVGSHLYFNLPTVRTLNILQYEFHHPINEEEILNEKKIENFLDEIMATEVMERTETFLKQKGLIKIPLRQKLKVMWFELYSRYYNTTTNNQVASSCAFEHLFVGEVKKKKPAATKFTVIGFHNWLYYYSEQLNNRMNRFVYNDKGKHLGLGDNRQIAQLIMYWNEAENKRKGSSFFFGTSPELEIAVYTICFLAKPNKPDGKKHCPVKMNDTDFEIFTSHIRDEEKLVGSPYKAEDLVGNAYPVI